MTLMQNSTVRFGARFLLALIVAGGLFLGVYRPLHLVWGATAAEAARTMPGDDAQPHPIFDATRAVTIDAAAKEVWPWIVQIGYGRAGWYGLDGLDNGGVPSARRIIPELQGLKVGDKLPIFPATPPFTGDVYQTVATVAPDQYLLTKGGDGTTWVWALYPVAGAATPQTRLVWRMRSAPYDWTNPAIAAQLLTELVDYVAVSENMLGIKERAEGWATPAYHMYLQAGLWLIVFVVYLAANVGIVTWRRWPRALALALAAGLVTIALALTRPPLWVDAGAALAAGAGWYWARRAGPKTGRRTRFSQGAAAARPPALP